jgi:hypothetical protein
MNQRNLDGNLDLAVRDGITRAIGAIGLGGMALIHVIDAPSHFGGSDAYLGFMYVGLIVASLTLAGALITSGSRLIWATALILMVSVIVGYVLSRTVGLPASTADIGNWSEPLGIAAVFVEGSLVALATAVLASSRRSQPVTGGVLTLSPDGHSPSRDAALA